MITSGLNEAAHDATRSGEYTPSVPKPPWCVFHWSTRRSFDVEETGDATVIGTVIAGSNAPLSELYGKIASTQPPGESELVTRLKPLFRN